MATSTPRHRMAHLPELLTLVLMKQELLTSAHVASSAHFDSKHDSHQTCTSSAPSAPTQGRSLLSQPQPQLPMYLILFAPPHGPLYLPLAVIVVSQPFCLYMEAAAALLPVLLPAVATFRFVCHGPQNRASHPETNGHLHLPLPL